MSALKHRVAEAFDQAVRYDDFAGLQRRVAELLAGRIARLPLPPNPRVLEIGCGTGLLANALDLADTDWLMTDIAPAMVERSRRRFARDSRYRFAVLDGENPRLDSEEGPFDLVCASLVMQWFEDLEPALERLFRLLRPGGHLVFSTLAEGTFAEWRQAHRGLVPGTHAYPDADALRGLRIGGAPGAVEIERFVEHYRTAADFLRTLRGLGAATPRSGHRPLPPATMRNVMRRFEAGGAESSYCVALCRFTRGDDDRAGWA
jgi:malonyl-CoA O-methyltransferase